jgi:hypothetical protein
LRNLYAKIGMFGTPLVQLFQQADSGNMGDQVRGFGFTGDGSIDTLFRFLTAAAFAPTSNSGFPRNNPDDTRRDVEQYLLAFDSDLAPIVGQQITLSSSNAGAAGPRIDLLLQRAAAPFASKSLNGAVTECDVVAHLAVNGSIKSYLYDPGNRAFAPADGSAALSDMGLRALADAPGQEITYTAWPPGSGARVALSGLPRPRLPVR